MLPGALAVCVPPQSGYTAVKSIDFDGVNDYVNLGNPVGMSPAVNDGTGRAISVWFKSTDAAFGNWIFSKANLDLSEYQWGAQLLFGQIAVWCGGGISYGGTYNDGLWHHLLVAIHDVAGTPTLGVWVDGVLDHSSTAIYAVTTASSWYVGAADDGGTPAGFLPQQVTNVTFWSGVNFGNATATELYNGGAPSNPTTHSLASGLKAWYKFGDGDTFNTLLDTTLTSSSGTMVNMVAGDIVTDAP